VTRSRSEAPTGGEPRNRRSFLGRDAGGDGTRVVIAYNRVDEGADPSTADVLDQVALVKRGLDELGLPHELVSVAGGRVWETIEPGAGTVVFNLLEAPPGAPQRQSASAAVLELLDLPFTGSPAAVLWLTTDKVATRAVLASRGLPVPAGGQLVVHRPTVLDEVPRPWIVKPAWEDASVGLDGQAVCASREAALARASMLEQHFPGQPVLVEHFLPGREFNVGLIEHDGAVEVLPVAEMEFVDFPPEVPAFVSFEAKWETGSFGDLHTQRAFPDPELERPLLGEISTLARETWAACGLCGYARVDIRLDEAGRPHILDVNANPCLSAVAGFAVAAARAGLGAGEVVRRILAAASRRWARTRATAE
jgi:D-alanine-D-alanine ligase